MENDWGTNETHRTTTLENWTTTTGISTNCCDKCGRSLDGKGWVENLGMKICGVCELEIETKNVFV